MEICCENGKFMELVKGLLNSRFNALMGGVKTSGVDLN
jgi:hypothetical protein